MPTLKKRINITLSEELEKVLGYIAKRDRVPVSTVASNLVSRAIEHDEDIMLAQIADERFSASKKKGKKGLVSHKEVWKLLSR